MQGVLIGMGGGSSAVGEIRILGGKGRGEGVAQVRVYKPEDPGSLLWAAMSRPQS